jgi:hypothetical protein
MKQEETTMTKTSTAPTIKDLLNDVLPPIVFRNHPKFKEWTGYSNRTVANKDCLGTGPDQRLVVGRVTGYPNDSLIRWLEGQTHRPIEE